MEVMITRNNTCILIYQILFHLLCEITRYVALIAEKQNCSNDSKSIKLNFITKLLCVVEVKYSFDLVNCDMYMHRNVSDESEIYKVVDAEAITQSKRRERV